MLGGHMIISTTFMLQNGGPCEKYDFWKDIYSAFGENYIPTQFASNCYIFSLHVSHAIHECR